MADGVSETGKWIDSQTGKLVDSEPVEGFQVVPKGGTITPDVQAQIDRAEAALKPSTVVVDLSVQEAPAVKPAVSVPTAPSAPRTRGR